MKILAHDDSTGFLDCGAKIGRVDIGKNVFIGSGSIVLCGMRIGDNSIIGANIVVSKGFLDNSVYAGTPAKFICSLSELRKRMIKLHCFFDEHGWNEWKNAPLEDKIAMKEKLRGRCGYVR